MVAEALRGYGMNVTAVILDPASVTATNEAGDFDLMLASAGFGGGFTGSYTNNQFECRLDTDRIRSGFCDEDLDELLEAVRTRADNADAALDEAVRLLTEVHMPWVPLYVPAEVWAMQPYVNGFVRRPDAHVGRHRRQVSRS